LLPFVKATSVRKNFVMKRFVTFILFLALASFPCGEAAAQKRGTQLRLIETGEFHGDEITARTGERWLGLFPTAGGFSLRPSALKVEAVHDPVVDESPATKTGKRVSVGGAARPVFLLKGAGRLPRGAVRTAFAGEKNLGNAETIPLSLGGRDYVLRVVSDDPNPAGHLVQNSRLILTSGGESQVLFSAREHDDAGWSLLWAGDLDGDGELDLYLDLSRHYNTSERRLFLSTPAARKSLVREVAAFSTVGC
jgi:hypothetical protein